MGALCESAHSISKGYATARNSSMPGERSGNSEVFSSMSPEPSSEPDPAGVVIYVGQDRAGHWLVQDSRGRLEGRFVSRTAAMSYARDERDIYHARLEVTTAPLVPQISFDPVAPDQSLRRAA